MRRKQTWEVYDMIVLKYRKTGSVCFISHIDLLRHMDRVIRRGKISINYSQGFNPHALMYFSPPLSLGISSIAEYLTLDTNESADVVFEKFNAAVPDDLKASKVFACEKNPNLQAKVVCADFVFNTPYRQIEVGDKFEISYEKKGEIVTENVASKIFSFFEKDEKLVARLASGSVNLRPDRILQKLNEILGEDLKLCDVEKVAQYVDVDGKLVEVDRYLQK